MGTWFWKYHLPISQGQVPVDTKQGQDIADFFYSQNNHRSKIGLPLKKWILIFDASLTSVQSLSHVWLFATPWIVAHQASLSITNSWSLLKLMSIELVMPSNHLILCHPLLLLPSIFPSIRVFSNESAICMRWPKYWSFTFHITYLKFSQYELGQTESLKTTFRTSGITIAFGILMYNLANQYYSFFYFAMLHIVWDLFPDPVSNPWPWHLGFPSYSILHGRNLPEAAVLVGTFLTSPGSESWSTDIWPLGLFSFSCLLNVS